MQNRYVIAIAIEQGDNRTLFAHRSPAWDHEYKGYWSLPSLEVSRYEFEKCVEASELATETAVLISKARFEGMPIHEGRLLISGTRQRTDYLLYMAICTVAFNHLPLDLSPKYDKHEFFTPEQMLEASGRRIGTCCSLYFQGLINRGCIAPTCTYLEIPPDIADSGRPLEKYTPDELWKLAAPNYSLLIRGLTGGEGHLLRNLILDRFLGEFIDQHVTPDAKVIDVGCGEGRFLENLRRKTNRAVGLELVDAISPSPTALECIFHGSAYEAPRLIERADFDLAVMNLLVFWLADLDSAFEAIGKLLIPGGHVLLTSTPPEFTKNGNWVLKNGNYNWITTGALRRDRMLTMINRSVGPVWFYPRSTANILDSAAKTGLRCDGATDLYLDSFLTRQELEKVLQQYPYLRRHQILPAFCALTFSKK
jgi:SAM-dependent methyltransferase